MAVFLFGMFTIGTIPQAYAYGKEKKEVKNIQGTVSEIINVANYIYAEIETKTEKVWVAGPTTALKKRDTVSFPTVMPMKYFYSESMKRNFSLIYFISSFSTDVEKVTSSVNPSAHSQIKKPENIFKRNR